jgi:hypothetical protein
LVEHQLPKLRVAGSNPVARSGGTEGPVRTYRLTGPILIPSPGPSGDKTGDKRLPAGGRSAQGFKFGPVVGRLTAGRVRDRDFHAGLANEFRLGEVRAGA